MSENRYQLTILGKITILGLFAGMGVLGYSKYEHHVQHCADLELAKSQQEQMLNNFYTTEAYRHSSENGAYGEYPERLHYQAPDALAEKNEDLLPNKNQTVERKQ